MDLNDEDPDAIDSPTATPPSGWPRPRAAYIHVPFCRHRCGYCNFSVVANRDDLIERFLAALDVELTSLHRPRVETVFVGGGTPTRLNADQLTRLLNMIGERFEFTTSDVEYSIEANPEDVSDRKLDILADCGVNRVSLGVQSFNDEKLRLLERGHRGESARRDIARVTQIIPNVSIDLIFAAPGETLATWEEDVRTALSLPIRHLSTYTLTFEKGAAFWGRRKRGQLQTVDEQVEVAMYELAREVVSGGEMQHYEISNFALPNARCRHNLAYWGGQAWFAAGPGAARFVDGCRAVNHRSTTTYLRRIESGLDPTAEAEGISLLQYARERAAFGVRMIDGVDLDVITRESGVNVQVACGDAIERCLDEDLVEVVGPHLRLTQRGILFADTVASRLLS